MGMFYIKFHVKGKQVLLVNVEVKRMDGTRIQKYWSNEM